MKGKTIEESYLDELGLSPNAANRESKKAVVASKDPKKAMKAKALLFHDKKEKPK